MSSNDNSFDKIDGCPSSVFWKQKQDFEPGVQGIVMLMDFSERKISEVH